MNWQRYLLRLFKGEHLKDNNVIYLRDSYFQVESREEEGVIKCSDVDGEIGPPLPLEVKLHQGALKVFSNL